MTESWEKRYHSTRSQLEHVKAQNGLLEIKVAHVAQKMNTVEACAAAAQDEMDDLKNECDQKDDLIHHLMKKINASDKSLAPVKATQRLSDTWQLSETNDDEYVEQGLPPPPAALKSIKTNAAKNKVDSLDDFLKVFAQEISDIATTNDNTNNNSRGGSSNGISTGTNHSYKLKRDNKDLKSPRSVSRHPQHQPRLESTPIHNNHHNNNHDHNGEARQERILANRLASPLSSRSSVTDEERNGHHRSDELDNVSIASSALPGMLSPTNLTPRKSSLSTLSGRNTSSASTTPRKNTATSYTSREGDGSNSEASNPTHSEPTSKKRVNHVGRSKSVVNNNDRRRSTSLSRKLPPKENGVKDTSRTLQGLNITLPDTYKDNAFPLDDIKKYGSAHRKIKGIKPKMTQPGELLADESAIAASTISESTFGHHYVTQEDFEVDAINTLRQIRQKSAVSDEICEMTSYLNKCSFKTKKWKRGFFVLKHGKLRYYKSHTEVSKKPKGCILLNEIDHVTRADGTNNIEIVAGGRSYLLSADTAILADKWIKVFRENLKQSHDSQHQSARDMLESETTAYHGWLHKVKLGRTRKCWCQVTENTFFYFKNQGDKIPLGIIPLKGASVHDIERESESDIECNDEQMGGIASNFTIAIDPVDQPSTYILVQGDKKEKDNWLYHIALATGNIEEYIGSEYEKLMLRSLTSNLDFGLWKHPIMCHTKEPIRKPLTTLPSEPLQKEAMLLFKSLQLYTSAEIVHNAIGYHVSLIQNTLKSCWKQKQLQNEFFCQLIKQTSNLPNEDPPYVVIQYWQFLFFAVALFPPKDKILQFLQLHLYRSADETSNSGRCAIYCQYILNRALENGSRHCFPSKVEITAVLMQGMQDNQEPISLSIHLTNGLKQDVHFDSCSTIAEVTERLATEIGIRKPYLSGFALYCDNPWKTNDMEYYLQPSLKICDVMSKWEQTYREGHSGKLDTSHVIKFHFKNRYYLKSLVKDETEMERLLLIYQVSSEVCNGKFRVNKDLALELAALMAQIEFGDYKQTSDSNLKMITYNQQQLLEVLDRFYPKQFKAISVDEMKILSRQLAEKWSTLCNRTKKDCIKIYITVVRRWPHFGSKIYRVKQRVSTEEVAICLAVHENGFSIHHDTSLRPINSYSFESIISYICKGRDLIIVVDQHLDINVRSPESRTQKLTFVMDKKEEATEVIWLIAGYISITKANRGTTEDNQRVSDSIALHRDDQIMNNLFQS